GHEHLRRPARAAQQRRGAHLAVHRDGLAVRADRVEAQIRVRIHEVDAADHAVQLDGLRAVVEAHAVVRERRARDAQQRDGRDAANAARTIDESQSHGSPFELLLRSRFPTMRSQEWIVKLATRRVALVAARRTVDLAWNWR